MSSGQWGCFVVCCFKLYSTVKLSSYILVRSKLSHCTVVALICDVFAYKLFRLGQGREKALQYLRENPTISDEIEKVCWIIPGFSGMYATIKNFRIHSFHWFGFQTEGYCWSDDILTSNHIYVICMIALNEINVMIGYVHLGMPCILNRGKV